MCGMNCGTVSLTAWPILRDGLDGDVTVTDEEAEAARQELKATGVDVGPCAAATLAALRTIEKDDKKTLGIGMDSVVVLLATEGPR